MGGRITSEPLGIACPEECEACFPEGSEVTLTATHDEGFEFAAWTGDCENGDEPVCTLSLDEPHVVGASFDAIDSNAVLTVVEVTGGTITSDRGGISCPDDTCWASFAEGTQVTLTAHPSGSGKYTIVLWGGACATMAGVTCTVEIVGVMTVSAAIRTSDNPPIDN